MKKIIVLSVLAVAVAFSSSSVFARGSSFGGHSSSHSGYSSSSRSDHTIRAYTKSNGTHVGSSHATNPDATRNNNYSTKGNVNPYTGKLGTKSRDGFK
ncbi:hypothetical protein M2399_002023 [Pseudomonas sp. BIGb0450]|jgi:hypothetical protein|nr:hypothetical protein [Pseudomonas sp. BIGb0558]MCS3436591.1 hypothetical protein [Pseudomonas sp. BIGb0450]